MLESGIMGHWCTSSLILKTFSKVYRVNFTIHNDNLYWSSNLETLSERANNFDTTRVALSWIMYLFSKMLASMSQGAGDPILISLKNFSCKSKFFSRCHGLYGLYRFQNSL